MGHERGEKMSPRTGRPVIGLRKDVEVKIRFDKEMNEKLLAYCQKNNITRTEAIRKAVAILVSEEKK